jgi:AcrR family transcriptional regulator
MAENQDRRVRRTTSALHAALFELIGSRGYDRISVQDIIDRADVGRSTFYAHFRDKDDLLLSSLDMLTADLDRHLPEPDADGPVLPSLGLFMHIEHQHHIFEGLFRSRAIDIVERETRTMLEARALRELERRGGTHPVATPVRAAFLAGALMWQARWWISAGRPGGPQQAAADFDRLVEAA